VGLKPTRGVVPTAGVVPSCVSFDSISVFARTVGVAVDVLRLAAGPYRSFPPGTPVVPSRPLRIGVVRVTTSKASTAPGCGPGPGSTVPLGAIGTVSEVDLGPYLRAGELLYDVPW
jgi:allophanate hydrolase